MAAEWRRLGLIHNAIGYSDEGIELWLARWSAELQVEGRYFAWRHSLTFNVKRYTLPR